MDRRCAICDHFVAKHTERGWCVRHAPHPRDVGQNEDGDSAFYVEWPTVFCDWRCGQFLPKRPEPRGGTPFSNVDGDVVRLYEEGRSVADVAIHVGRGKSHIYAILARNGVTPKRKRKPLVWTDEMDAKLHSMFQSGETEVRMAAEFDTNPTAISKRISQKNFRK